MYVGCGGPGVRENKKLKKFIKLALKFKFEKAREYLILHQNDISAKEIYEKFEEYNLLNKYEFVKLLVEVHKCYNSQLMNDFELFEEVYNDYNTNRNPEISDDVERLLKKSANPERYFFFDYDTDMPYSMRSVDLVKRNKDFLILFMKNGVEIEPPTVLRGCNSLINSYNSASIDFRNSKQQTREEYYKINSKNFTEEQIKEHALVARYGIKKRLKDAMDKGENDNENLELIQKLNNRINKEETEYMTAIQERDNLKQKQREEADANYDKTKELIEQVEDAIFNM